MGRVGISARYRLFLAALAATVFFCIAWRRLIWLGLVPIDGNVIAVTYPNWFLANSLWSAPRLPLWNPFRGMGVPYAADPITSALYPPMWLLSKGGAYDGYLRGWVVVHTLIACAFSGALAWRWYKDRCAAVAAGLLGGFNGFFTSRVVFQHNFSSAAWLPAILYFQDALSPIGLGVCLALQWLAGYPTFSILSAAAAFFLAVQKGERGLRCFIVGSGWAAGLSAVQWVPFLEFLKHSQRGWIISPEGSGEFSIPLKQLLVELFVPQWPGLSLPVEGDMAMVCFYVGLVAVSLSLYALRIGFRERAIAAAAVMLACLSMGKYLPGYRFIPMSFMFRYPSNFLLLLTVCLTLLCAAGISRLKNERLRWFFVGAIALDLLVFSQWVRVAWAHPSFLEERPALASSAQALPQPVRIYHTEPLMRLWGKSYLEKWEDYELMRDFLSPSYATVFGLQDIANYQTMRLKSAEVYRMRLERGGADSPLLDWAGAQIVVALSSHSGRLGRENFRTWRNLNAKPRVFFLNDNDGYVKRLDYHPGRIGASVVGRRDGGEVVLSETSYPGWEAWVDGRKVEHGIFEGNFIQISLPSGEHELLFRFNPLSFWAGLAVTSLTLSLLFLRRKPSFSF